MTLAELIVTMPGEATATDSQVLAWLQEPVTVQRRATGNTLRAWAATGGRRARLARMAQPAADGSTDAVASLAQTAVDILLSSDGLDTGDPRLPALLDGMQAAGILTPADRAELMEAGAERVARWSTAYHREPELIDIAGARG